MAEHPNVSLLRNGYDAFEKGDIAALTELFSEDVVWHVTAAGPLSGEHRGRDAVFATFARIVELSEGTFKAKLHDVVANDEHAVALVRATATRQGKQLDSRDVSVYHIRNGKATEFWSFVEDQRSYNEFWS